MTMTRINTVGELRKFLKGYPDDKLIILDAGGNTDTPEFYEWIGDDRFRDNPEYPIGITASIIREE